MQNQEIYKHISLHEQFKGEKPYVILINAEKSFEKNLKIILNKTEIETTN